MLKKKKKTLHWGPGLCLQDLIKGIELPWATIQSSLSLTRWKDWTGRKSLHGLPWNSVCSPGMGWGAYLCPKPREGSLQGHHSQSADTYIKGCGRVRLGPLRPRSSNLVCVCSLSCVWLCDAMDCSPPGSSIHGIFQARVLEWVAIFFSRRSSRPRDRTRVSCIPGRCFTVWATRES